MEKTLFVFVASSGRIIFEENAYVAFVPDARDHTVGGVFRAADGTTTPRPLELDGYTMLAWGAPGELRPIVESVARKSSISEQWSAPGVLEAPHGQGAIEAVLTFVARLLAALRAGGGHAV